MQETGFFQTWNGGWQSPQGEFFLGWYSDALLEHGERMLTAVTSVFNSPGSSSSGAHYNEYWSSPGLQTAGRVHKCGCVLESAGV